MIIVLLIALGGGMVAKKLRQPILTGYLISGILVTGLFGRFLHFTSAQALADLGLAFLMFVVGLDFSFRRLARVKRIAVGGAILQMLLTVIILAILGLTGLFGSLSPAEVIVAAVAFSLSSTAIVIKLLSEKGELDTLPAEILVGWLLVQDLAVVPILTVLPVLSAGGPIISVLAGIFLSLLKAAVLLYLVLFLGKKVVPIFFTKVAEINSREILLLATVSLVLISAAVTYALGLSFALGAFLAGLLVADNIAQHAVFSEIRPLRDIFAVIFFVTLGVLLSPVFIWQNWLTILIVSLAVIMIKFFLVLLITVNFKYHLKTALQVGLSLTLVSEFAFVIARLALNNGAIGQNAYSLILAVTMVTMMVSPWEFGLSVGIYEKLRNSAAKWSPRIYKMFFNSFDHYRKEHKEIEIANHVVICGHGRVGRHIARIMAMAGVPYVVVDYNHNVISDLEMQGVETVLGDPTDKEVLQFAGVSRAGAVVAAVPDRYSQELIIENALSLKPGITIICRSHFEEDQRRLYALGVSAVVSPEFEAGLSMGHRILDSMGFERNKTAAYLKMARREQGI